MSHTFRSSFIFTTQTPFNAEYYRKARHIINHIIDNPESIDFRQPVDWQGMGLTDYLDIIKYPIDLGTVKQKLDEEKYQNVEDFLDDFQLIWENCKNYNIKGTWIYALADKLEKNGRKMLKNYFPNIPIQTSKSINQPPPKPPKSKKSQSKSKSSKLFYEDEEEITLPQKQRLADAFRSFSPAENKELVEYIQSVCPTAFREVEERVQIVVDNMDILTFKQIMLKVEEMENLEQGQAVVKKVKQN